MTFVSFSATSNLICKYKKKKLHMVFYSTILIYLEIEAGSMVDFFARTWRKWWIFDDS